MHFLIFYYKHFEALVLLQIPVKSFQTILEFSSQWSHKSTFEIFEILKINILMIFFFLFVFFKTGQNQSENFKMLLFLQIEVKLVLNLPPNGPHQNTLGLFEF